MALSNSLGPAGPECEYQGVIESSHCTVPQPNCDGPSYISLQQHSYSAHCFVTCM